ARAGAVPGRWAWSGRGAWRRAGRHAACRACPAPGRERKMNHRGTATQRRQKKPRMEHGRNTEEEQNEQQWPFGLSLLAFFRVRSVFHPWLFFSSASEFLQVVEEARIGLGDTAWVLDDDARHAQADEGQAHRHAVVVVGLDLRP